MLCVDPGWNTGLAYFLKNQKPFTSLIKEPPRMKKLKLEEIRLEYMFDMFEAYLKTKDIVECWIEGAETWEMSAKSLAAAERGNTFALAYMVGGYTSLCYKNGVVPHIVKPSKWKGQLNDIRLAHRLKMLIGEKYPQHIQEAVGVGMWVKGVL